MCKLDKICEIVFHFILTCTLILVHFYISFLSLNSFLNSTIIIPNVTGHFCVHVLLTGHISTWTLTFSSFPASKIEWFFSSLLFTYVYIAVKYINIPPHKGKAKRKMLTPLCTYVLTSTFASICYMRTISFLTKTKLLKYFMPAVPQELALAHQLIYPGCGRHNLRKHMQKLS